MAGSSFLDVCRFNPTAGGTTDWTMSSNVGGYQSPAAAGVVHGGQYSYRAESTSLSEWEIGLGTYNTGTGVLTRGTVLFNSAGTGAGAGQSGAGSKINFAAAPQIAIVALAEDLLAANVTKAIQQTGTDTAKGVTPATQQHHDSAAKAWVSFNSSGTILASYNIASVTRSTAGTYSIVFTTPFASANYVATGSASQNGSQVFTTVEFGSKAAGSVTVFFAIGGTGTDPTTSGDCVFFGRQ